MITLAAITAVVLAIGAGGTPAVGSTTVICKSGKVCKGTEGDDWIFGSRGNDNIRAFGGSDHVFANGGDDVIAHSYGDDRISGGCGRDTLRGGFGIDRIFANMPPRPDNSECVHVTPTTLTGDQITALEQAESDTADDVRDLVDCAYIDTREDPALDVGYAQDPVDVVVDCFNRDDQ
jgi:Ca2+-binding RTX toxin-like protein